MAYRDKEKQREAARARAQRFREKQGVTPKVTPNVTPRNAQNNALPVTPSVTPSDRMLQPRACSSWWLPPTLRLADAEARITDLESRLTVLEARQPAYAPEPRIIAAPYRPVRGSGYQERSYAERNAMAGQIVTNPTTGKPMRVPALDADGQPIPE